MEVQSNPIPEPARSRYERVWADFSALVQRGETTSLSAYCRTTHTSYDGIKCWMRSRGLSVRFCKKSNCTRTSSLISSAAETPPASFIQFTPSANPSHSSSIYGVSITFPDGVNLSIQESSAEGVADLLSIYKSRCKAAGGL